MRIRKDTWHYRVWKFTYFLGKEPDYTNLCRYVSRTILLPIPCGFGWLCLIALCAVVFIIGNAFTILSGTGVLFVWEEKNEKGELVSMLWKFPDLSVGGRHVQPSAIVLPSYVLLIIAAIVYMSPYATMTYAGYALAVIAALALLLVIGAAVVDGYKKLGRWEGWKLFMAYLKAKKQGVCPVITFDEPDHSATAEVGEPKTA